MKQFRFLLLFLFLKKFVFFSKFQYLRFSFLILFHKFEKNFRSTSFFNLFYYFRIYFYFIDL
ncbi:hypothetical protein C5473_21145 [Leptospira interrogans serovar Weerasinghe]|nr:hypothetical protein C5473_21145 [Leptospira interrogans serovar Weerasinghe]